MRLRLEFNIYSDFISQILHHPRAYSMDEALSLVLA